jgi:phage/plasmid-like protein (TIGR03299 family)
MKTNEEKAFDLLESTGLNWSVEKENLISKDNAFPTESYGMFRKDTNKWLGTGAKGYVPLQNGELAMILFSAIEDMNINLTRGGELNGGKKVYMQAELKDEYIGKSEIKRYVTCLNSHDVTTSVGFGSSNTVVICQNTYFRAYGEVQKFRHTTTMKERIELAKMELRKTIGLDTKLMETYKRMADIKFNDVVLQKVIENIFEINKDENQKDLSSQKKTKIIKFAESVEKSIEEQGQTVWALFNGVTRYTNHILAPSEITKKMDYLMLQGGVTVANTGFKTITDWMDAQPKSIVFDMAN